MMPMLNEKSIKELVQNEGLEAAIEALRDENARIRSLYRKGDIRLADAEKALFRLTLANRAAHEAGLAWVPRGTAYMKCLSSMTCASQATYRALLADYHAWLSGNIPDSPDGTPWLFNRGYKREIKPNDFLAYWRDEPATSEDKTVFFALLEATFYPVELFSPPPDDMLVPIDEINLEAGAFGGRWWAEGLYCTMDVSCLLSRGNPIGQRFDLAFDDGGIAHITITEMEYDRMPPLCIDPDPDRILWKATGWIEGYTCEFEREIEFVSDGLRVGMGLIMAQVPDDVELADQSAYQTSPMWAPFRNWEAEYKRQWHAAADRAMESFLFSNKR